MPTGQSNTFMATAVDGQDQEVGGAVARNCMHLFPDDLFADCLERQEVGFRMGAA